MTALYIYFQVSKLTRSATTDDSSSTMIRVDFHGTPRRNCAATSSLGYWLSCNPCRFFLWTDSTDSCVNLLLQVHRHALMSNVIFSRMIKAPIQEHRSIDTGSVRCHSLTVARRHEILKELLEWSSSTRPVIMTFAWEPRHDWQQSISAMMFRRIYMP